MSDNRFLFVSRRTRWRVVLARLAYALIPALLVASVALCGLWPRPGQAQDQRRYVLVMVYAIDWADLTGEQSPIIRYRWDLGFDECTAELVAWRKDRSDMRRLGSSRARAMCLPASRVAKAGLIPA